MSYRLSGKTGEWEIVCGLEIHAQVSSKAKLFSGASTEFGAAPNQQVSLVDAAMPGMLPVINQECIRQAIRTGIAINATVNPVSVFARKNYFYADLPQGYQISQFDKPIIGEGEIRINLEDGSIRTIGIERLHLEQDAGKSLHDQHPSKSYIDLNRSGVALMEIVSKPDIRSPEEATAYVSKIRAILRYIGACDGNMAEGSLRADVNVSVRKSGEEYGTRTELKNLNSLKFIRQAMEYEARRQIEIIENGGQIDQETRLFDVSSGTTRSMRSKEDAHDYRYFPDPDLLPLLLSDEEIEAARQSLPELPDPKMDRFIAEYSLSEYDAMQLVAEPEIAAFFETAAAKVTAKLVANWILSELFGRLNKGGLSISQSPVSAEMLSELIQLIEDGSISGKMAKDVFDDMFETGKSAGTIVDEKGLKQVSDTGALTAMIDKIIADNQSQVEAYRSGKTNLLGWFVGQIMKESKGSANPKLVNLLLKPKLDG